MPRYAVVSDIHGNLPAWQAVLADIKKQSIERILCAGDIVGYYPNPNECVESMIANNVLCVLGNHDKYARDKESLDSFTPYARAALSWTREHLSEDKKEVLRALKYREDVDQGKVKLVHAALINPEWMDYITHNNDGEAFWSFFHGLIPEEGPLPKSSVTFFGHTHQPTIFSLPIKRDSCEYDVHQESYRRITPDLEYFIKQKELYAINVGSVGQPRDHDPRACYVIYDTESHTIEFHRVRYDIAETQRRTRAAGLPEKLAYRLEIGI